MKNILFLSEDFTPALQALNDVNVPITAAYKIAKNVDSISQANKVFGELRQKLVTKYCDKYTEDNEEKGQKVGEPKVENSNYSFTPENAVKFNEEMIALLGIDFTIPHKLSQKDLGDKCSLKTKYLLLLADMFSDLELGESTDQATTKEAANG